jgi:hypothetical protein
MGQNPEHLEVFVNFFHYLLGITLIYCTLGNSSYAVTTDVYIGETVFRAEVEYIKRSRRVKVPFFHITNIRAAVAGSGLSEEADFLPLFFQEQVSKMSISEAADHVCAIFGFSKGSMGGAYLQLSDPFNRGIDVIHILDKNDKIKTFSVEEASQMRSSRVDRENIPPLRFYQRSCHAN